jgi:hypothetical protein
MLVGLNAGFGLPLTSDWPFIQAAGCAVVRQEFAHEIDDATTALLMADVASQPIRLLALLGGGKNQKAAGGRIEPHEFATLGVRVVTAAAAAGLSGVSIEVGNEPDIGHAGYSTRPADFAGAIRQTHLAVRGAGFLGPVITGAVSNLSTERLDYLQQVVTAGVPLDVVVGFHRYPHGLGPEVPHPGFASRDAEWARLQSIAAGRAVACTEVGHHTARRKYLFLGFIPRHKRLSDETIAEHVTFDLTYFRNKGCLLSTIYQLNDGPTDTAIDRYGIRRTDGTAKPAATAIAAFVAANP